MAAETPNPEAGFTIDGKVYEIPTLDSLSIDECQVLYDYSGLTVEDFVGIDIDDDAELDELEPEQVEQLKRMRNPGFLRALLHVAYARGNRHLGRKRVEAMIGNVNMLDAMVELAEQAVGDGKGADADPPASTTELDGSSPRSSVDSSRSSGPHSEGDSDEPASRPTLTTVGNSPLSESIPTRSGD